MRLSLHNSNVFKLNKYLSVRFKDQKTVIYIKREKFIACKYLLMNAPVESITSFESIDQMSELLDSGLERELTPDDVGLKPIEEFRGHCSNLQVWVEHNYDTCLLHRNLAFPLLKKLTSVGDAKARDLFSLEVVNRFKSGHPTVQKFLILEKYLSRLKGSVLEELIDFVDDKGTMKILSRYFDDKNDFSNHLKTLKRLLWIDPIHYKAYLVLAFTYLRINKILNAKLALKELLKIYPNDEEALLFLASLYHFEGETKKANDLINTKFTSRNEFVEVKSCKYSSLITKIRYEKRFFRPKMFIDFP